MMKQLRLSGSGGQGVITAAIIFAEAAVSEGKQRFSPSHMDRKRAAVLPKRK